MFMPEQKVNRPYAGNLEASILIVGDTPDADGIKNFKPLGITQDGILLDAIHQAGLIRDDVCVTNLVFDDTRLAKYWREDGAKGPSQLKGDISGYKKSLWQFIQTVKPKVIVAMGELSAFALTGRSKITSIRGYPFRLADTGIWVLPVLHVSKMSWSNYIWRHYLAHDLKKAVEIATNPECADIEIDIKIPQTCSEAIQLINYYRGQKRVAWDIEVSNFHTSCMSFSSEPAKGCSIPIDMRWSENDEHRIWLSIAGLLEDRNVEKVVQNGAIFDAQFMAYEMGIFVRNVREDTMIAHHIMYPDFLKGLEFLASIYTKYPYWKDELKEKSIKEDN